MLKHCLPPLLAVLALAGCRTNPACERQIGLMRSELIALEDKYYALEAQYRDAVGHDPDGESCQPMAAPVIDTGKPSATPPNKPGDSDIRIQLDPNDTSVIPIAPRSSNPVDPASAPEQSVVTFQTPRRFAGNAAGAQPVTATAEHSNAYVDSSLGDRSTAAGAESAGVLNELIVDSSRLVGFDKNTRPGDDGVSLVIHLPRDRWTTDGRLSVSVLDPGESGELQRIGLWRFVQQELTPAEIESGDDSRVAISLDLGWNQNLPANSELMLFARWENANAPSLEHSQGFAIDMGTGIRQSNPIDNQEGVQTPRLAEGEFEPSNDSPQNARQSLPAWNPNR